MKKILLILIFFPILVYSQASKSYKEFNCGVMLGEDINVFPGASFLWGKTIYYTNTLLDYQYGLAFPTVFTGKIGVGIGDENKSFTFGVRPFPTSLYMQYIFSSNRLVSIETMPPVLDSSPGTNWALIINYGYRW